MARYFDAVRLQNSAGAAITASCVRRENGIRASNNDSGPVVDPTHPEFGVFSGSCANQIDRGYVASLAGVRRRALVVDSEWGLVLDLALFDYSGAVRSVPINCVGDVAAASSFAAPATDIHAQLFKIESGEIIFIEDAVRRVPYGQASVWDLPFNRDS